MTADVVSFPEPARPTEQDALFRALVELHALVTIDPTLGASPVRVYLVVNPGAKIQIDAHVGAADRVGASRTTAYALISFDFPFALQMFHLGRSPVPPDRAKDVIVLSSELQEDAFRRAAEALGVKARSITAFDAEGLKSVFFPDTQETAINLFKLTLLADGGRVVC